MRKIKNTYIRGAIVAIVLAVASTSCNLDEYNPSGSVPSDIWGTPEGFATAVNGAYSELRYWYGKEDGLMMAEAGTDIWANKGWVSQLSKYSGLSSQTNYIKSTWKSLYSGINVCNAGLDQIGNVPFTDDNQRKGYEGQLRFLRAFYYWHVVETWGNVVLREHATTTADATEKRSPVTDFYDLMISDLLTAVEYLPNDWKTEYGRASKKAALGFLAKVYLSRAYYGDAATYFAKARDAAKEVIARQAEFQVALKPNYADLWNSAANNRAAGKAGGEGLFVIANSLTPAYNYDANGNRIHATYQTPYNNYPGLTLTIENGLNGSNTSPVMVPTEALLDMFDETMDSRYNGSFQTVWYANNAFTWTDANKSTVYGGVPKDASVVGKALKVGDTAMFTSKHPVPNNQLKPYLVFDLDSTYLNSKNGILNPRVGNYPTLKKFRDYNRTSATTQPGYNDVIVLRLSEMYLIAAEAELQLSDPGAAADHINVIRTRAAIKTPVDHTADMQITAADVTLDFILDERAREFAGEHKRWFDLKRTKKLIDRVKLNPDIPAALDENYYLRPVSIDELTNLNNAEEFGQNPGFN